MEIIQNINLHADQVLPHQLLKSWLKSYKRPNDKIPWLRTKGFLLSLKKGLYIAGPSATKKKPDVLLIANEGCQKIYQVILLPPLTEVL